MFQPTVWNLPDICGKLLTKAVLGDVAAFTQGVLKMRAILVIAGAAAGLFVLAGCAGQQLSAAKRVQASGSEFSQNLYRGYLGLSQDEFGEADYRDSDAFAGRAIQTGSGKEIPPEEISARDLPADKVSELDSARASLIAALGSGAAGKNPSRAADAQVMFDCWMQEQEENRQPDDIARCRDGFYAAVAEIAPAVAAAMPKPQTVRFIVYFPTDKAVLDGNAQQVIAEARAAAAKLGQPMVKISGHTDTVGSASYNQTLSELRAQAVAKMLATGEMKARRLETEAHGKMRPAVMTPDGTNEARNRRVEIILEP